MSYSKEMNNILRLQAMTVSSSVTSSGMFFSTNSIAVCCSNTLASTLSAVFC